MQSSSRYVAFLFLALIATCNCAKAALILNPSFEDGILLPAGFQPIFAPDNTSIHNWTVGGGGVDYINTFWPAASGSRSVDLSMVSAGSISQTLTDLIGGQWYRITYMMAGNPDTSAGPNTDNIKSLTISAGAFAAVHNFDITGSTMSNLGWQQRHFDFQADGTTAQLLLASNEDSFYGPVVDDFSISIAPETFAVPEPSSCAMVVIALLGLSHSRARRRLAPVK